MDQLLDWLDGRVIDLRGRKKIVRAAGVQSKTGDVSRQLMGFGRHLERQHGYSSGDFLETTYRGRIADGAWQPAPYQPVDAEAPLADSTAVVARQLRWYDVRLPDDLELHLIGYSLGGVVLFRAAVALLAENRAHWASRIRSVVTLASPLHGSDLGPEGELLNLFGLDSLLLPGGAIGRELCALGRDPAHRVQVERDAEQLRRAGVRLLTLGDANDTVVTPEDSIVAPPAERARYTFSSSRAQQGGLYAEAVLGHGPLLENPRAWALMVETIGPQVPRLRTPSGAIPL
jgi:pimeloyl-ACP methyl ester carboxylesterase